MPTCPDLRARVAQQLTALSVPGAVLHRDSAESTRHRYPITDTDRARFHRRVIDWYPGLQDPPRDGRSAIVSAGPSGAGKTTMLRSRIADIDDYRIIDADTVKDHIIAQALADGHALAPRELSALVHEESVGLADQIHRACVLRKENVVIEGTLAWHGQGSSIFRDLANNDYTEVEGLCPCGGVKGFGRRFPRRPTKVCGRSLRPMSKRVSPAARLRAEIDDVFAGGEDLSRAIERVAQLGAQLLLQSALEAEVAAFLGRDRYERAASCEDARAGMRNGYCPTTVKTTAGPVTLERPKVRNTTERFASQLFGKHVTKTNALEALVIAGFVRGLSTRDVEAALTEALGEAAAVSKSTVSRICADIKEQFNTWCGRRLDDVELDYLFLDGSHFKYHAGASAEPVLAAWGIDTDGKPVFVGLNAAAGESGDAWAGILTDLGERGLACPLLVISDGAPGLIGAVERTLGGTLRQRCLIHVARNVMAKVPTNAAGEVKADYWAIFDVSQDIQPGVDAVKAVQARIDAFAKRWRDSYPAAVRSLPVLADRESLTVYLRFPREHWNRVRHSNFIERTFGETRRRVKVIGRLPGEHSCLSLVWAVLDRASAGWRGFSLDPPTDLMPLGVSKR